MGEVPVLSPYKKWPCSTLSSDQLTLSRRGPDAPSASGPQFFVLHRSVRGAVAPFDDARRHTVTRREFLEDDLYARRAPVDIYDPPASAYVARLLGSPVMNILPLRRTRSAIEAAGGALVLDAVGTPPEASEIGVRPEDLQVLPFGGEAAPTLREVEPLGKYTVVTIDAGEIRLRATVHGQPDIRVDTRAALRCDPARAHFFGPGGFALART